MADEAKISQHKAKLRLTKAAKRHARDAAIEREYA